MQPPAHQPSQCYGSAYFQPQPAEGYLPSPHECQPRRSLSECSSSGLTSGLSSAADAGNEQPQSQKHHPGYAGYHHSPLLLPSSINDGQPFAHEWSRSSRSNSDASSSIPHHADLPDPWVMLETESGPSNLPFPSPSPPPVLGSPYPPPPFLPPMQLRQPFPDAHHTWLFLPQPSPFIGRTVLPSLRASLSRESTETTSSPRTFLAPPARSDINFPRKQKKFGSPRPPSFSSKKRRLSPMLPSMQLRSDLPIAAYASSQASPFAFDAWDHTLGPHVPARTQLEASHWLPYHAVDHSLAAKEAISPSAHTVIYPHQLQAVSPPKKVVNAKGGSTRLAEASITLLAPPATASSMADFTDASTPEASNCDAGFEHDAEDYDIEDVDGDALLVISASHNASNKGGDAVTAPLVDARGGVTEAPETRVENTVATFEAALDLVDRLTETVMQLPDRDSAWSAFPQKLNRLESVLRGKLKVQIPKPLGPRRKSSRRGDLRGKESDKDISVPAAAEPEEILDFGIGEAIRVIEQA